MTEKKKRALKAVLAWSRSCISRANVPVEVDVNANRQPSPGILHILRVIPSFIAHSIRPTVCPAHKPLKENTPNKHMNNSADNILHPGSLITKDCTLDFP